MGIGERGRSEKSPARCSPTESAAPPKVVLTRRRASLRRNPMPIASRQPQMAIAAFGLRSFSLG